MPTIDSTVAVQPDIGSLWTSRARPEAPLPIGSEAIATATSTVELKAAVATVRERVAGFSGRLSNEILEAVF